MWRGVPMNLWVPVPMVHRAGFVEFDWRYEKAGRAENLDDGATATAPDSPLLRPISVELSQEGD